MHADVLNSWKEIAAYLGRGVRTVQRWEQDLGLPVRRPRGKERSAVIALKPDLDRWLHQSPQGAETRNGRPSRDRQDKLHVNTDRLLKRTNEILERSARIQEMVKVTVALTAQLREQQADTMRSNKVAVKEQKGLMRAIKLKSRIANAGGNGEHPSKVGPPRAEQGSAKSYR